MKTLKATLNRGRTGTPIPEARVLSALAVGTVALLVSIGAMNGGVALTAGVWDALLATLQGILSSTWTLAIAVVVLIGAVWQLAQGRGYGQVGVVIGVLALALIGPGFMTTLATATRSPDAAPHVSVIVPAFNESTVICNLR